MHCDSICFIGRPFCINYNYADCDNDPCATDPSACCEGGQYAAGHLTSRNYYIYGHFEWYNMRPGQLPMSSAVFHVVLILRFIMKLQCV